MGVVGEPAAIEAGEAECGRGAYPAVTTVSVAVALVIGTIELVSVLADKSSASAGPMRVIAAIPLDHAGFVIVGLFLLSWLGAAAAWKWARSARGLGDESTPTSPG